MQLKRLPNPRLIGRRPLFINQLQPHTHRTRLHRTHTLTPLELKQQKSMLFHNQIYIKRPLYKLLNIMNHT